MLCSIYKIVTKEIISNAMKNRTVASKEAESEMVEIDILYF